MKQPIIQVYVRQDGHADTLSRGMVQEELAGEGGTYTHFIVIHTMIDYYSTRTPIPLVMKYPPKLKENPLCVLAM